MPNNTLRCYDLIQIKSGEIFTLNGNFDGQYCRATLSFYPRPVGDRLVGKFKYQKVTYETSYKVSEAHKCLDLPGQQQFILNRNKIVRLHKASDSFLFLEEDKKNQCRQFMSCLSGTNRFNSQFHGLTGSSALKCRLPTSDFDWVLYRPQPNLIRKNVSQLQKVFTFDFAHAYQKYAIFSNLLKLDINNLFETRWKYVLFQSLNISLNFVDPNWRADKLINTSLPGQQIVLTGKVLKACGCYYLPYTIKIKNNKKNYTILSWIYLYNGAFADGELIEVSGKKCLLGGQEYIVVENPQDYIRKLVS